MHAQAVIAPDAVAALASLGGSSRVRDLDELCGRSAVRRAIARGEIRRIARGRYALPQAPDPRITAVRLSGVVSHQSAARLWGIAQLDDERRVHVTIPPTRGRVAPSTAVLHWAPLAPAEVKDGVTVPLRAVLDVCRTASFRAGLACADSALRERLILPADLAAGAARLTNRGSRAARRVADYADARAASVLESGLRAIVIDLGLAGFVPQLQIDEGGFRASVDLGHRLLRMALEADSFEHHGHRSALARDCHRYCELSSRGWLVLRFAWEHVMFDPDWVAARILQAVALRAETSAGQDSSRRLRHI
jgi:very-short-patch-repair endonuclease